MKLIKAGLKIEERKIHLGLFRLIAEIFQVRPAPAEALYIILYNILIWKYSEEAGFNDTESRVRLNLTVVSSSMCSLFSTSTRQDINNECGIL